MGEILATVIPALYTVPEAAAILRVTPETLYEWLKKDYLSHVKLGKTLRITPVALQRFINDHDSTPVEEVKS